MFLLFELSFHVELVCETFIISVFYTKVTRVSKHPVVLPSWKNSFLVFLLERAFFCVHLSKGLILPQHFV